MRGYCWLFGVGLLAIFAGIYCGVAAEVTSDHHRAEWRTWQKGYEPVTQIDEYGEPTAQDLHAPHPPAHLSWVQQPWCFWSALGFSIFGMVVLLLLDLDSPQGSNGPMVIPSWFSVPLGLIMIWLGPGSMLEHGTLRAVPGWFDSASIHWFGIFISTYVVVRWIPGGTTSNRGRIGAWVAWFWLALVVGLFGAFFSESRFVSTVVSLVLMGLLLVADAIRDYIVRPKPDVHSCWDGFLQFCRWNWRLGATIGAAGIAFLFFFKCHKGDVFASFGHGVWHIAVASATFFIYLQLRQQEIETSIGS